MRSNIHHPQVSRPFPLFDCFCHIQHFAPFILLSTALDIREREFVVARTRHSPFRHFKIQKLEKDRSVAKVFLMNEKSKVFPFAVVFIMKEKKKPKGLMTSSANTRPLVIRCYRGRPTYIKRCCVH